MPRLRGWATYTESTIARLKKEGHGSGLGSAYKPWLTVRDASSHGLSSRSYGWKTNRVHHVLSDLELHYLYCLEWSPFITDIREQYPLPLDQTVHIAEMLGISHPKHPKNGTPVVLTTDFLIAHTRDGPLREEARTTKYVTDLASRRTLEKFEIERVYWAKQGIQWGIVTEREVNHTLAYNVEKVHHERSYPSWSPLALVERIEVATLLTRRVLNTVDPLHRITSDCDRTIGLALGTSLAVAYYLIATRQWLIDMAKVIDPMQPLVVFRSRLESEIDRN